MRSSNVYYIILQSYESESRRVWAEWDNIVILLLSTFPKSFDHSAVNNLLTQS
jgi:hypothetical protein